MNNQIKAVTLIALLVSGGAMADIRDETSGVYVQGGVAGMNVESPKLNDQKVNGGALTVGYDINKIVGVSLSVQGASDEDIKSANLDGSMNTQKIDVGASQIGTDIGYTFSMSNSITLKPYVSAGVGATKLERNLSGNTETQKTEALFAGVGAKMTVKKHFIVSLDLRQQGSSDEAAKISMLQAGYKF
ncbi:porin family protein [Vibrio kyushuensis]|uniref:porin family protein n=1 Tax=Vibrio kyushuensis TaxID=2910249 RepID=UPI003D0D21B8